jgi:hypothetical protein
MAITGFCLAWLLAVAWGLLNAFVHPGLRAGMALEAITVALCPAIVSLMAAGDKLLPQLTTMVVVSLVNAGWYWMISKFLIWIRPLRSRDAGVRR